MRSAEGLHQPKSDSDGMSSMPGLCHLNESTNESSIGTNVGAAQLDFTNRYIPIKYSLDRYLEDFRSYVCSELLMGYTWSNQEETVANSIVDMERYLEHFSKKLGPDFPESKNHEILSFLPSEGSGQLAVFPARRLVSEGENKPWELSTGRQTTQPRRSRKNGVNKQSSKRPKSLTRRVATSDQTSIRPDVPSSNFAQLSLSSSPFQVGTQFLPDQLLASLPLSGPQPSVPQMSQPSSSLIHNPSDAINDTQFHQYYPSTIPDPLAGQKQRAMTVPFPSVEEIHKDNTTSVFQLRDDSGVKHRLPYFMLDAIPSPSHGTISAYGNSTSSAPCSLNDSIWPSVASLVFGSSSESNSTSPFTSTSDYSMTALLDEFDSNMEAVPSLSDETAAFENGTREELISKEMRERCDGSANVTFDWNEFLNFKDVVED
jgi:hypothetical protein